MSMMFKRILASLLAAAALASFTSCGFIVVNDVSSRRRIGEEEASGEDGEDGAAPEATGFVKYRSREDAKALSESYVAALPERDYEGAVFFVTTPDRSFLSPEDTETVLSRLALQRNEEIAERFNVTLLTSVDDPKTMLEEMKQAAEAGTFYTDLLLIPFFRVGEFRAADLLMNMRSAPFFSMDQPYFNAESSQMTSGGYATYAVAGAASISPDDLAALYMNKTVLKDAGEDPFALFRKVEDGTWTWDVLLAELEAVRTNTDAVTLSAAVSLSIRFPDLVFKAMGNNFILTADRREPLVGFSVNSAKKTMEILASLYQDERGGLDDPQNAGEIFSAGGSAFFVEYLTAMESLTTAPADWSVLPLPKGSEASEGYKTLVANDTGTFAIPKGHTNPEIPAVILSGLNAASYGYMNDSYVEYHMMNVMRDNDSVNMLDLILDTASFDFAIAFGNAYPAIAEATYKRVRAAAPTNTLGEGFTEKRSEANRIMRENFDLNY